MKAKCLASSLSKREKKESMPKGIDAKKNGGKRTKIFLHLHHVQGARVIMWENVKTPKGRTELNYKHGLSYIKNKKSYQSLNAKQVHITSKD